MVTPSGAGTPRIQTYATVVAYNEAYPDAPLPTSVDARSALRSYTVAGAGMTDDLTASEKKHTLDFLPGGAPEASEPERFGLVVASRWGGGPYLVLAENVSLRKAWDAITGRWPAALSEAAEILRGLPNTPAPGTQPL
jgi:hypothetical protein